MSKNFVIDRIICVWKCLSFSSDSILSVLPDVFISLLSKPCFKLPFPMFPLEHFQQNGCKNKEVSGVSDVFI